jgi:hypothetical protein
MAQIQLRLRPTETIFDVDLADIERRLRATPGVGDVRMYDDRLSDATFVTAVVMLDDQPGALAAVQRAVVGMEPGIVASFVAPDGEQTPVADVGQNELRAHLWK